MTKVSLDGFEKALLCIGLAHYKIKSMEMRGEVYPQAATVIKRLEKKLECHSKNKV